MAIDRTFNGVSRASADPKDYMVYTAESEPKPDENFQQGLAQVPNPVFDENENSDDFLQNLADQRDMKDSLMGTLRPDKDYQPPKVDAQSLMRDATKVIKDGANVSQKAAGGMEDVQKQKAEFKQDFKDAKAENTEMLKDAAKDMGIDPNDAEDQMMAKGEKSNLGMMANAGAMAVGGPAAAGLAMASSVRVELSEQDKKLPVKEQKALLEDTLKNLQASRKPLDSREEAASRGKIDAEVATESPKQSEFAWEDMEIEDLAALMVADPEGEDQPEWEALMDAEYQLAAVQRNHQYAQEHYADGGDMMGKMLASAESNGATAKLMADAQVVTATIDSGDVQIAGNDIKDVVCASDTSFDSASVQTVMDWNRLDDVAVKQQLDPGFSMNA